MQPNTNKFKKEKNSTFGHKERRKRWLERPHWVQLSAPPCMRGDDSPTTARLPGAQIPQGNTQAAPGNTPARFSHQFLMPDGNSLLGSLSPSWVKLPFSLCSFQLHQARTKALCIPQWSLRLATSLWPFLGLSFPIFNMRLIALDDMRHLPVLSSGP